jgi:hypothetical protein
VVKVVGLTGRCSGRPITLRVLAYPVLRTGATELNSLAALFNPMVPARKLHRFGLNQWCGSGVQVKGNHCTVPAVTVRKQSGLLAGARAKWVAVSNYPFNSLAARAAACHLNGSATYKAGASGGTSQNQSRFGVKCGYENPSQFSRA